MNQKNVYLASKPRYAILDGLRGVAALVVILFHGFETYIPFFGTQHINHGYLAVDFFFVLSGFVIGYAYDDRGTGCQRGVSSNAALYVCIQWWWQAHCSGHVCSSLARATISR